MPTLTLTRINASKTRVTLASDSGKLLEVYEASLMSQRQQAKLLQSTKLPPERLTAAIIELENTEAADDSKPSVCVPYGASQKSSAGFSILLRGREMPEETGTLITPEQLPSVTDPAGLLRYCLNVEACPYSEPLLEWGSGQGWERLDHLACCDIDYHGYELDKRPTHEWLIGRAAGIQPVPVAFHVSHGRGMKLYYAARDGYTAGELAAVAAVGWLSQDKRATADVIRSSRHPRYPRPGYPDAGAVTFPDATSDLAPLAKWLQQTIDPNAVDDFLNSKGWQRGMMLPHCECPIDPSAASTHAHTVLVGDAGLYCHKCGAAGQALGRTPGFTHYSRLIGGVKPRLARMIAAGTHWTHARLVMRRDFRAGDTVLEAAYSAAVKLKHGPDSDVARSVSAAGRDVIRIPGRWTSPDGRVTFTQNVTGILNALPAVWEKGTRTVAQERRDLFFQSVDLSHHGYPAVTPVNGCIIYGKHLPYPDDRVAFSVPAAWASDCAPRYRPLKDRMDLELAWSHVETAFPGINRNYVKLLLVLKGFAEGGTAQAPFCFVTGVTGSAKSSTVHVAASICGDVATEPTFTPDSVRLMQAFAGGLDAGSFVVLNEIVKEAQRAKIRPRAAFDPILNLTPDAMSHRLYIGPRPLGRLPALVCTDINPPITVCTDAQLARRLIWVQLDGRLEWEESVQKAGFGKIGHFRAWNEGAALACDAILSDVIDAYFTVPMPLHDVAEELGFKTLEKCGMMLDQRGVLRRFFHAVCKAPDLVGSELARRPNPGWKIITRGDTSELAELWEQICDGVNGDEWKESRIALAEDWSNILGVTTHVQLELANYRNSVYARFKIGISSAPEWCSKYDSPLQGVSV